MDMVHHTRLDTSLAPAGLMRQAVAQATHHTAHRKAFQALLTRQPLMKNVLADLALESEAATALVMRVARAFDDRQLARLLQTKECIGCDLERAGSILASCAQGLNEVVRSYSAASG